MYINLPNCLLLNGELLANKLEHLKITNSETKQCIINMYYQHTHCNSEISCKYRTRICNSTENYLVCSRTLLPIGHAHSIKKRRISSEKGGHLFVNIINVVIF